jgi:hydroxymethylpyrimidine pyrophosphatase-like HAD family hydrolase
VVGLTDDIVPPAVSAALRRVEALGVPLVLVTGRAWLSAQLALDQLGLQRSYCVCNNGATTCTYPPLDILRDLRFDPQPIFDAVRGHDNVIVAVEEFGVGYRLTAPFPPGELHGEAIVTPLDELASGPVSRIILRDPVSPPEEFQALVATFDLTGLSYWLGWNNWLDLASNEADKAQGLAWVCERLGIARADVIAFGDGSNDVELLRWAGRGVALGDAPRHVKAAADAVTACFDDGGIIPELDRWFPPAP